MVLSLLLPTTCAACGRRGPSPCVRCWARLRPAPPGPPPAGVERSAALLLYEGPARELVARLKYRNARAVLRWLAAGMAALVRAWWPSGGPPGLDVVTWAPTTADRRRARGFDQAELLAVAVAAELRLPARPLLRRGPGPPQTGRAAAERARGVSFAALPAATAAPAPRVLVVDDVCTTGATLAAAARALRAGRPGVAVMAVTAARTPLKLPPP